MLRRKAPLPRLTDVTLTAPQTETAAPDAVLRLYQALLAIGLMVQVPARLMPLLAAHLVPERTLCGDETDIRLNTVDTTLFYQAYEAQFAQYLRQSGQPTVLHVQGDPQLATALAASWLHLGGASAATCLPGTGRCAALAPLVMLLSLQGETTLNPRALPEAADAWEAVSEIPIPAYQPVLGKHIFDVSSGVHVDGLLKDSFSYEPFPPEAVGRERRIVLDQHSGQSAVAARLRALQLDPGTLDLQTLTHRVREQGRACGKVDEAAFATLIRQTQPGL